MFFTVKTELKIEEIAYLHILIDELSGLFDKRDDNPEITERIIMQQTSCLATQPCVYQLVSVGL